MFTGSRPSPRHKRPGEVFDGQNMTMTEIMKLTASKEEHLYSTFMLSSSEEKSNAFQTSRVGYSKLREGSRNMPIYRR
ncbi:hypothetical protein NDU88_004253 [Pleurodeles waltl]|uniref:Uncharacterized protein n=1 Tax=Pleurodeles waltl TaxID=8319 RepID=A0AAV7SI89_PLEWA|nr:hypothetical protein NDU88_004253 [Pleurodeles waltl]